MITEAASGMISDLMLTDVNMFIAANWNVELLSCTLDHTSHAAQHHLGTAELDMWVSRLHSQMQLEVSICDDIPDVRHNHCN